jgi:hypothetical protein
MAGLTRTSPRDVIDSDLDPVELRPARFGSRVGRSFQVKLRETGDGDFRLRIDAFRARGSARCNWIHIDPHPRPPTIRRGHR